MLEPCDGKLSRTVLRGEGSRKAPALPGAKKTFDHGLQCTYTVNMKSITFEWDNNKAEENKKKHGISFNEAQSVFFDEDAVQFWDKKHTLEEERFLMLGLSNEFRILLVVHCYREDDATIRIISARKATKKEKKEYPGVMP